MLLGAGNKISYWWEKIFKGNLRTSYFFYMLYINFQNLSWQIIKTRLPIWLGMNELKFIFYKLISKDAAVDWVKIGLICSDCKLCISILTFPLNNWYTVFVLFLEIS